MKKRLSRGKSYQPDARPEPDLKCLAEGGPPCLYLRVLIAKHLFVFTFEVSQYHAFDFRRPTQLYGLIIGPCDKSGYAQPAYNGVHLAFPPQVRRRGTVLPSFRLTHM
jgi:hypothetical protein